MVLRRHDGRLQVLIPDTCSPVPNRQEVFGVEGVAHKPIDWPMMACITSTHNAMSHRLSWSLALYKGVEIDSIGTDQADVIFDINLKADFYHDVCSL